MGDTITYTPRPSNSFFSMGEINEFFNQLADMINNKIDDGRPEKVVDNSFNAILVGNAMVVIGDGTTTLGEGWGANYQQIINLQAGTDPSDAITLKQFNESLLGLI